MATVNLGSYTEYHSNYFQKNKKKIYEKAHQRYQEDEQYRRAYIKKKTYQRFKSETDNMTIQELKKKHNRKGAKYDLLYAKILYSKIDEDKYFPQAMLLTGIDARSYFIG